MPGEVDEKKWDKAKAEFKKKHNKDAKVSADFAIVSSIYKKMGGKFGKEMLDLVESIKGLINFEEIQTPAKEKDVDAKELKKGIKVEMEHTDDKEEAKKIALQHLAEVSDYYTKLEKHVEEKMEYLNKIKTMSETVKVGDKVHCPSGFCKVTRIKGKKITVLSKSDGEFEYDSKQVSEESFEENYNGDNKMEYLNKLKNMQEMIRYDFDKMQLSSDIENEVPAIQNALRVLEQEALRYNVKFKAVKYKSRNVILITYSAPKKYGKEMEDSYVYIDMLRTKMKISRRFDVNYKSPKAGIDKYLKDTFGDAQQLDKSKTRKTDRIEKDVNAIPRKKAIESVFSGNMYLKLRDSKSLIEGRFSAEWRYGRDMIFRLEVDYKNELRADINLQSIRPRNDYENNLTVDQARKLGDAAFKEMKTTLAEFEKAFIEFVKTGSDLKVIYSKYPVKSIFA